MHVSLCTGNLYFLLFSLFSERSCGHSLTINRQQRGLHCEQDTNVPSMHVCSQRHHQIQKLRTIMLILYKEMKHFQLSVLDL